MPTSRPLYMITLLNKPLDHEGWSGEEVTLALSIGDLTLHSWTTGRVVEMIIGEGVTEYIRTWTVDAGQVEQVRRACIRTLFPDQTTLSEWLAKTGVNAAAGEWYGFTVRPTDDQYFLLEAVRTILGVTADDEGTTVANRFIDWLTENGISHTSGDKVRYDD